MRREWWHLLHRGVYDDFIYLETPFADARDVIVHLVVSKKERGRERERSVAFY